MQKENVHMNFEILKQHVISMFPDAEITERVPPDQQEKELKSLYETIGSERFYFVVDLTNFEITEKAGIQRWLGYSEKQFTYKQYWNLIHPGRQMSLMLVAMKLYESLCSGKYPLDFMVQRYSSLVALKHSKGHYLLIKKTSSVFQYDNANRLTAYLNEFTIIGQYNGEPLLPVFFNKYGESEIQKGTEVMKEVIEYFLNMKVFSVQELQIARKIIYSPSITQKQIAEDMALSLNSVSTYCKRFLKKAREFFHLEFASMQEAALHLKKNGLL